MIHLSKEYNKDFYGAIFCPDKTYFDDPGINNSGLHTIKTKSPYHFHMLKKYDEDKTTEAFRIGHMVHALILGTPPLDFYISYSATKSLRGKAYEDFKDHLKEKGIEGEIVLESEKEQAEKIYKYAREQNDLIDQLQSTSQYKEIAGFYNWMGYRCKAKADAIHLPDDGDGILWDIKTTNDLFKFHKSARDYGYHMQQAWYRKIFQSIFKRRLDYRLLVIEKKYPYSVVEYDFSDRVKDQGRRWMEEAFSKYAMAIDTGIWAKPDTKITIDWRY